jgi:alkylmercury lyase
MSRDEVTAILHQLPDIEYDSEGNIVASGLSLTPTPHHFQVNGNALFTWCALDALAYPMLLQQSAYVESPCPVTGGMIWLTITPERIEGVEPASTVVSFVIPEVAKTCCDVRGSFCCFVHFFSSPEAATVWLLEHQDAFILPVDEAYRVARIIAEYRYGEALGI